MAEQEFMIRRKVFTFFGAKFHIYNAAGELIGFCKQKAFKLREDIRVYTDESLAEERLAILARQVIDFSATYDVIDSDSRQIVGGLQREGIKSMVRNSWRVLDAAGEPVGAIQEDSLLLALVRRFVANLVPLKYELRSASGKSLARFRTHFNPFVHKLTVTIPEGSSVHPILILAAGILLVAIEGRQN